MTVKMKKKTKIMTMITQESNELADLRCWRGTKFIFVQVAHKHVFRLTKKTKKQFFTSM
mgnify:CR=1 FL=1